MRLIRSLSSCWVVAVLFGCTPAPDASPAPVQSDPASGQTTQESIDPTKVASALERAVRFLCQRQGDDGAWRSDLYASFKDGTALTPLILSALQHAYQTGVVGRQQVLPVLQRGYDFLNQWSQPDGSLRLEENQLEYPVYTAALILEVLSHPTAQKSAANRPAWVRYLKDRQLTEVNGWQPDDVHYGGWGYCRVIPRKPQPGRFAPPFTESNLSATVYALEGLAAAGALDAPTARQALVFIRRMQNWGEQCPEHVRDGGFRFVADDPVRNKAGLSFAATSDLQVPANREKAGFPSYGSMTSDGYRALLWCQRVGATDPQQGDGDRLKAAAAWLSRRFRTDRHPGDYIPAHETNRDAVYYYYVASAARAFTQSGLQLPPQRSWAAELAAALCERQQADGRWENPCELVRENDPLAATAQAVIALSLCYQHLQRR